MNAEVQAQALLVGKGEGRALWHLGALLQFKALSSETNGQLWVIEGYADKTLAIPLHAHSREDEFWYVLEGNIRFTIGSETIDAGVGGFAYIPRSVPHTFQIISNTARWLGVGTPGGFDDWFFETGEPAPSLTLPPPPQTPPNVEALVSSLKQYGTDTLGPPPTLAE